MGSAESAAVLWGLGAACVVCWLLRQTVQAQWRAHVARLGIEATPSPDPRSPVDLRSLIRARGVALAGRWPITAARVGRLAASAGSGGGRPTHEVVGELVGWKLLGALAGVTLGALAAVALSPAGFAALGMLLGVVLAALGWLAADIWLARRAAARRRTIEGSLLVVADLLTLCLEAGMGIDRALRLICGRMHSPLADELLQVLAEIELGAPRREAFAHLGERVPLEEIRALASAIIQAEELSASLAGAMRTPSRSLRVSQRHKMEADAQRAPVKMLVPMVVFVLPALFIVILGPLALQLVLSVGGS